MFKIPFIQVGTFIMRPALVNLQCGLTPMTVTAPLEKQSVTNVYSVMGHCVYAVAGDLTHTGVAPKRFSSERPGWRALQGEVANPKNGKPLGCRVYLMSDLPEGWTHIKMVAINKHVWSEPMIDGKEVVRTCLEYRGEAESDPSMFTNYYREAYLSDLGASKGRLSKDFLAELDFIFDEGEVRTKLGGGQPTLV